MPECPQQEGAFLAVPKCGYLIVDRKLSRGVAPGIVVLEIVAVDDVKERCNNTKYGSAMNVKGDACVVKLGRLGNFIGTLGFPI